MALTVRRAGAAEYGQYVKMLVVADPGAGKTRTASTWPDVLYANCEAGLMSVADRHPAAVDIETAQDVKELLSHLKQPAEVREQMLGVKVGTVVVDTLDEIARILIKERLEAERKDVFAMADWGWLGDQLRGIVRTFRNLDMNVILNVHLKSQEDSETGRTVFKPQIQGAMGDELAAYVDLAVLMVARPNTTVDAQGQTQRSVIRYFQTYPDLQHPWVKDRSGKLPLEFPINFEDDYERMRALIYGNVPAAGETVVRDAPPIVEEPAAPPAPEPAAAAGQEELPAIPTDAAPEPEPELTSEPVADTGDQSEAPADDETQAEETVPDAGTEPEAPAEPEPEPAPAEASTPNGSTPAAEAPAEAPDAAPDPLKCADCEGPVENQDQADFSFIRHRVHLCRSCMAGRKKKATA